jgi:hypothetical protein
MNTKALKPFDLERALAGDKVVIASAPTLNIVKVYHIPELQEGCCKLLVTTDKGDYRWVTENCLRMAPKKVIKWLNLYSDSFNCFCYDTEEEADQSTSNQRATGKAIKIEYEE